MDKKRKCDNCDFINKKEIIEEITALRSKLNDPIQWSREDLLEELLKLRQSFKSLNDGCKKLIDDNKELEYKLKEMESKKLAIEENFRKVNKIASDRVLVDKKLIDVQRELIDIKSVLNGSQLENSRWACKFGDYELTCESEIDNADCVGVVYASEGVSSWPEMDCCPSCYNKQN